MKTSLILKLRLVLKIEKSKVCSDLVITEKLLDSIELEQQHLPYYLIQYYSIYLSVKPNYLKMFFRKSNNLFYKAVIKLINKYFNLILTLRKAGEKE